PCCARLATTTRAISRTIFGRRRLRTCKMIPNSCRRFRGQVEVMTRSPFTTFPARRCPGCCRGGRDDSPRWLVLDQFYRVAGVVADERKCLGWGVAHLECHLDALGFQLREDRGQVFYLEAEVLHAVRP